MADERRDHKRGVFSACNDATPAPWMTPEPLVVRDSRARSLPARARCLTGWTQQHHSSEDGWNAARHRLTVHLVSTIAHPDTLCRVDVCD